MPDLEGRFWQLAVSQTKGFGIAPNCEQHLRQFIQKGIQNLEGQGFAEDEYKIHLAETNLSQFISEMTREAMRMKFDQLHEPTFFAVLQWICPLWPFC